MSGESDVNRALKQLNPIFYRSRRIIDVDTLLLKMERTYIVVRVE